MRRFQYLSPQEAKKFNTIKYIEPPSWELILSVIEKSKLKHLERFELAYQITNKTLLKYRDGVRGLPPKYWFIFYEYDKILKAIQKRNNKLIAKSNDVPKRVNSRVAEIKPMINDIRSRYAI